MDNNLIGMIELNLIDVYLGKHRGFGADEAYYKHSEYFIPSIACQEEIVFNELINNENVDIKNKLSVDFNELKDDFSKWKKDKKKYRFKNYLKDIHETHIASLIEFVAIFHKNNKFEYSGELRKQIKSLFNIYDKNKFRQYFEGYDRLDDPIWSRWEDYIYIKVVIDNEKPELIFKNLIRANYKIVEGDKSFSIYEKGKEKLLKSFLRVCLKYRLKDLTNLVSVFTEFEFISLLDVLRKNDFLPVFFSDPVLQEQIKKQVIKYHFIIDESNYFTLFFKKVFSIKLNKKEVAFAENEFTNLKNTRSVDYHRLNVHDNYAILSFVLGKNNFEYFLKKQEGHPFKFYIELGLYSALFTDYINLLIKNISVKTVIGNYIRYMNFYTDNRFDSRFLNIDISFLISNIFSNSHSDISDLLYLKKLLLKVKSNFSLFHFFHQLYINDKKLFFKIVNEGDLLKYENELSSWKEDYQSFVDRCFQLASFYSGINTSKSINFILKGINDGILRHGWRKDIIVSYCLVDALEILWKNSFLPKEQLIKYSKEVFNLTYKVTEITDGKGTWNGPYNSIELVLKYDIDLAYRLKKKFIKKLNWHNYSITLLTSFLLEKIKLSTPINHLEEEMKDYRMDRNFEGKPKADFFEEHFKVYLEIAISGLYSEEEKLYAFEKANEQVEKVLNQKIEYFLSDDEKYSEIFKVLCDKYGKTNILPVKKKEDNYLIDKELKIKDTNQYFMPRLRNASLKEDIIEIYKELSDYQFERILIENEQWQLLIEKTNLLCGNISMFIDLLKKDGFPHNDNMTSNSKYYHFGVAAALKNINTKKEILEYLYKYSGYEGFINIMKAYEVNMDKEMCIKLFDRFLKFCHLLVD